MDLDEYITKRLEESKRNARETHDHEDMNRLVKASLSKVFDFTEIMVAIEDNRKNIIGEINGSKITTIDPIKDKKSIEALAEVVSKENAIHALFVLNMIEINLGGNIEEYFKILERKAKEEKINFRELLILDHKISLLV